MIDDRDKLRGLPWVLGGNMLIAVFALWTFGGSVFVLFLPLPGAPPLSLTDYIRK